jgi:hypothetical protein
MEGNLQPECFIWVQTVCDSIYAFEVPQVFLSECLKMS